LVTNNSPDEVVFAVMGSVANAAERISLADAGLREREHLQEWVIAHPEIIGPDVMIVTFEFDKWSSTSGEQKDRLDVLGLGKDGRIVVAELKRGRAPDTVDMQALKYAAMAVGSRPAFWRSITPSSASETRSTVPSGTR
jgi:RecB family endonuclease NucS